jgi:hypothetical protein
MGNRLGNNPKRRIAPIKCLSNQEKLRLERSVRYVGSGHHKRSPANYGFSRVNPRPTKSLCDLERYIPLDEAIKLLKNGIQYGLFSEPRDDSFPKFIWSVSDEGEVFEAKTDSNGTGEYHGYPLEEEDMMYKYVMFTWKERCPNLGQ